MSAFDLTHAKNLLARTCLCADCMPVEEWCEEYGAAIAEVEKLRAALDGARRTHDNECFAGMPMRACFCGANLHNARIEDALR